MKGNDYSQCWRKTREKRLSVEQISMQSLQKDKTCKDVKNPLQIIQGVIAAVLVVIQTGR